MADADSDSKPNFLDLDSDNDGLPDVCVCVCVCICEIDGTWILSVSRLALFENGIKFWKERCETFDCMLT